MDDYFSLFLNNILDYLNDGVYFTDLDQNILYCNSGAERITGYRLEEIVMKKYCDVMTHTNQNGEQLCKEEYLIEKARKEGKMQETFMFIYHKDGHMIPATIRTFPVYDKASKLVGFIELIADNSRQKLGQDKMNALTQAAYTDSLTNLFNKQYLENRLNTMLAALPDSDNAFGVMCINIIGFRALNELYGITQGDKIIKMVANTLAGAITAPDVIARWHGASFIVISNTANNSRLLLLADKLKVLIGETDFLIDQETIHVNIAVGYTTAQINDTIDNLIERITKDFLKDQPEKKALQKKTELQEHKEPGDMFERVKECFVHPRISDNK